MKALDIFALMLGLALSLVEAYRRKGDGARAQRAAKRLVASGNIEEILVLYVDVLQRLRRGSPMLELPSHSRPSRPPCRRAKSRGDRHLQLRVALIASHSHSIYVSANRTGRLPGSENEEMMLDGQRLIHRHLMLPL